MRITKDANDEVGDGKMKKLGLMLLATLLLAVAPVFAQEHAEVGVFADYMNLNHINTGFWGVGGRAGFAIAPHVMLEGDLAYDFGKTFSTTGANPGGLGDVTTTTSSLHLLHGTFGPKIWANVGPLRVFAMAKGGFLNFAGGYGANSVNAFTGQFNGITSGDTNGVFYPGGGIELHHGAIGLRADAGDFIYFDRGMNHNIRITFGPSITF